MNTKINRDISNEWIFVQQKDGGENTVVLSLEKAVKLDKPEGSVYALVSATKLKELFDGWLDLEA